MNSAATQSPPTGPRGRWTDEDIDFYALANFLRAFGEYHEPNSNHFDTEEDPALTNRAEDEVNIRKQLLLQGYLNGVAYLCDVKKGGNTVSANGIDQNIVLYIAANADLPWFVKKFVIKVLMKTDFLNRPADVVVREVLEKAVEKARHRIDFYVQQLRRSFVNCRTSLETQFRGTEILPWMESLTRPQNHYQLVLKCYKARGRQLKELKKTAAAASSDTDWMDLIHYIGRLGAHNYHVLKIVTAYKKLPFLQKISKIVFIPSSPRRAFALSDDAFDYSATSKKVSKNLRRPELVQKAIYLHLMARWYDSEQELKGKLEEKREISTRVHAEILIFDYFVKNGLEFLDGYRYIGCSKPACYFCYHWLEPQGVRDLISHSKVILEWREPDLSGAEANMNSLKRNYDVLV